MFQLLLQQTQSSQGEDETLENLRYRWTLYKSKLKEVENNLIMTKPGLEERKELELRVSSVYLFITPEHHNVSFHNTTII